MSDPNPLAVTVRGVRWVPFEVEYSTDEGVFSFQIFAVSRLHAQARLDDLLATARVTGWEVIGRVPC